MLPDQTRRQRQNLRAMRAFVFLLMLSLAGCQRDPYTEVYSATKPATNDLVGVYTADTNTVNLIAREGHYTAAPPSIALLADGTIAITNIPDWWLTSFGAPHGGFDSGRGTWTVQKHQQWWGLSAGFPDTTQFSSLSNRPGGMSTEMMLVGQNPPYKIHLIVGDPDDGRGMEFERLPPEKASTR